jgi:hypothetical protein
MGHEAQHIGVVAPQLPVFDPDRVDGLETLGPFRAPLDTRKGCLLVRDRDVAPGEAPIGKGLEEVREILRHHVDALVGARDAVLLQPGAVDERRAGMVDRVPDHESFDHVTS